MKRTRNKMAMQRIFAIAALMALGACATEPDPVLQAFEDFVEVGELQESKEIRYGTRLNYETLNEHYVLVKTRKAQYLVKFARRCAELNDMHRVTPDYRREAHVIRSKFDTIRGCRIEKIYPVNDGQAEELKSLGDAPGATL